MVQLLKLGTIIFMFSLLLLSVLVLSLAEEAKLEMKLIGYGKTYQDIHLSFKNIGNTTISDITIYVDGKALKTIEGSSGPGITFEEVLFLTEGKHKIEARTPEGAYASLEVTASKGEVTKPTITPETPAEETKPNILDLIKKDILWIVLGVVLAFVVSIWLMGKKFTGK